MAGADDGWDSAANALIAATGVAGVVRRRKVTVASAGTDRVWETIRVPIWGAEEGAVSCETLDWRSPRVPSPIRTAAGGGNGGVLRGRVDSPRRAESTRAGMILERRRHISVVYRRS